MPFSCCSIYYWRTIFIAHTISCMRFLQMFKEKKCKIRKIQKNQNLVKTFCKDIDVKVVLTPFKISNKFSYKDPLPFHLQSFIIYKFTLQFSMWVKPQGTSSPESMNKYRKTLSPASLNICKNHVYVIVCAIRIFFQ